MLFSSCMLSGKHMMGCVMHCWGLHPCVWPQYQHGLMLRVRCVVAGWFGLLFYALASGLPILIQGFLGPIVQRRKPDLLSFTDYVNQATLSAHPA